MYLKALLKDACTSLSHFEAQAGLFRLLMKGVFYAHVLFIFELVTRIRTHDNGIVSRVDSKEKMLKKYAFLVIFILICSLYGLQFDRLKILNPNLLTLTFW